ncbi:hypothetical protein [Spartinivicinus poritis]|uniref:Uncharacterized protein n=1 Tax=Spartinivicinus poritis TaxID=2994640 RepID=A0ABT5UAT9_9GAMM|nr:hypothetical protein [Spartinivicinus sp. A2-2]MDE1463290.1 hypothetical protein [Spartinivicinus sp. A2-2]
MNIVRGYDAQSHPELIETQIRMKVGRMDVIKSGGNWKHLQKAIKYANSLDSPFVRVSFTDESGASHTATLSSDTENLLELDKYVKKRKIEGFGKSLHTAFPNIHNGIRNKMLELVSND